MSTPSSPTLSKKRASEDKSFAANAPYGASTGLEGVPEPTLKRLCVEPTLLGGGFYHRRLRAIDQTSKVRQKRFLNRKLSASRSRMPLSSQSGMNNFTGALCYRISLFQALFHQPKFVNWLLDSHQPGDCVTDRRVPCLLCGLRLLILGYWGGEQGQLSLVFRKIDPLFDFLGWKAGSLNGQADPDEQAAWLFGAMREVMPSSHSTSLDSIMEITTTSAVRCKCGHESRTSGHSDRALPVPISPKVKDGTLAYYLQKYMVEVVEDYRCEKCKDKSKKQRLQLIGRGPEVLAVQLKRFDFSGKKDASPVIIDTALSLNKYRDADNHDSLEYELTAVIKHAGSTGSGHYICSALGPDGSWYCFDDQEVSKSSVHEATRNKLRFTPYLLFFRRKEI